MGDWDVVSTGAPPSADASAPGPWDVVSTGVPPSTGFGGFIKDVAQTGAALVSGAVAPLGADVDRAAQWVASKIPGSANYNKPVTPYTADRNSLTYQPTIPDAQSSVNLVGKVLKPVTDVTHALSSVLLGDLYGDNNPEHIQMLADHLPYLVGLGGEGPLKTGADATADLPPSIATHPAVVAANKIAADHNLPALTKGQQVIQAASDLPPEQTGQAKALSVPYQLEATAARKGTKVGQQYDSHFATQQNALAGQVQTLADQVRTAGDEAAASQIENTIKDVQPGVSKVSGPALQKVTDDGVITDPDLAQKLSALNDYSGAIDPAPKGPIVEPSMVQRIKNQLATSAGILTGGYIGSHIGHPIAGAEVGSTVFNNVLDTKPKAGPLSTATITDADIPTIAKQTGLTPDQVRGQLFKQGSPAAPVSPAPTALNTPIAQIRAMAQKNGITTDEQLQRLMTQKPSPAPVAPVSAPVTPTPSTPAGAAGSTTPSVTPSVAPVTAPVAEAPVPGAPLYQGYGPPSALPPAGPLSTAPVAVVHPDITAANDLASRNGLPPLTAGQQLARRAESAPNAAQAKLAIRPYQSEVLAAQSGTGLGDAYAAHYAEQQNQLASQVQSVADQVRAAGDKITAKRLESSIRTTDNKGQNLGPGMKRVSGTGLQGIVDGNTRHNSLDEGLIGDPALKQKLLDLNDYSGHVDMPPVPSVTPDIGAK